MKEIKIGNLIKIPLDRIKEVVEAEPKVACSEEEIKLLLEDIYQAVVEKSYIPQTPTVDNPALSDDYIFDSNDENLILQDLKRENFVGKIKDIGKGAKKRKAMGLPDEYLYVFKYACKLIKREEVVSGLETEELLIYIKINNRKVPYRKLFVVSFHKNRKKN